MNSLRISLSRPGITGHGRGRLFLWTVPVWLIALYLGTASVSGQQGAGADDLRKGRELAIVVCANCHVAARDQPFKPLLRPPAPSFEAIAQRKGVTAEWVQTFLTTTHKGLDNPRGMPNPELLDDQVKQVAAYLLSLRKNR